MPTVKDIKAREILDSRGNPTIEVDLTLSDGSFGRAAVPSGASTGIHEALELRDGGKRYGGKGVQTAASNVEKIKKVIIKKSFDQSSLDKALIELDGTKEKKNLGANAILGVSLAFAKATAESKKIPLYQYFNSLMQTKTKMAIPMPQMTILDGGKHAINSADMQEFMIVPVGAKNFKEALRYCSEVYHSLGKLLESKGLSANVGFEGGYAPANLPSNEEPLRLIIEAIETAGYIPGKDVALALDIASSSFFTGTTYNLAKENKKFLAQDMISLYKLWLQRYPIISIEDALAEDDWEGFVMLTKALGKEVQLVGDDLFVTNKERLQKGIDFKVCNSILIKLNQIGTVTETIETIELAKKAKYSIIISHRSGETEDTTIADFAVGVGATQIKAGAPCRGERTAKYNQLLRIEEELGKKVSLASFK